MWRGSLNLLRFRHVLQARCQCSSSPKGITEVFKLTENVLPSAEFLSRLSDEEQGKVARIIAELEAVYNVSSQVPAVISDQDWKFMLESTFQIYDRQDYLHHVYHQQLSDRLNKEYMESQEKLMQEQLERFERGEMVYGRGFYEPYLMVGDSFSRLIYASYGNRLRIREQLGDNLPQFFVDCRFVPKLTQHALLRTMADFQRMYERNIMSSNPIPITFTNYLADQRVSEAAKKKLLFFFGPEPSSNLDTIKQEVEERFAPREYVPSLQARDFCSIIPPNVQKADIAYITQLAVPIISDEVLEQTKLFVFHAYPEQFLLKQNRQALMDELRGAGIKSYRLPLDANLKCISNHKSLSVSTMTSIIRDKLGDKCTWQDALLRHVSPHQFVPLNEKVKEKNTERVQIYIRPSWNVGSAQKEVADKPKTDRPKPEREKPKERVHKYSREERNRRRKEEAERLSSATA